METMKTSKAEATIPGVSNGNVTFQNTLNLLDPKFAAASSSDGSILFKADDVVISNYGYIVYVLTSRISDTPPLINVSADKLNKSLIAFGTRPASLYKNINAITPTSEGNTICIIAIFEKN